MLGIIIIKIKIILNKKCYVLHNEILNNTVRVLNCSILFSFRVCGEEIVT